MLQELAEGTDPRETDGGMGSKTFRCSEAGKERGVWWWSWWSWWWRWAAGDIIWSVPSCATGAGGGFEAGEVGERVGMISLCRYMAAWSSGGEHVEKDERCIVRIDHVSGIQEVQGHGYLPLSDNAWACVSGWGERKQGHH